MIYGIATARRAHLARSFANYGFMKREDFEFNFASQNCFTCSHRESVNQ